MSERSRIITVVLFVGLYFYLDQNFFTSVKGVNLTKVIVAMLIAMVVYSILVLLYKRKRK